MFDDYALLKTIDRQALSQVVDVMVVSSLYVIESRFPQHGESEDENRIDVAVCYATEQLGWNLSILFAQITGDGIGVSDIISILDLDDFVNSWIKKTKKKNWLIKDGEQFIPDYTEIVKGFMDLLDEESGT